MRSDYLIPPQFTRRVRRIVSEDSDRVDQSFLLIVRTRRIVTSCALVARDSRMFQHIAEFYNYLGHVDSYGRRLPGLHFRACTPPLNLPAPGRRQPLYVSLRFSRDLCF